ncbi:LysM peptidoglycan-binding domain-containing protein [Streptomyces chiangmaiensis]
MVSPLPKETDAHHHPLPAAAADRTLARVLKAVLSLLVLAAAVAGLPLLLAWATPVIWAATHDDLTHLLDRRDTGGAFLLLLVAVGWIGWAQFTVCAVRELIAQVRGRTWHAPRGMGASQRAAGLLIGSILVLLPTSSALASDAQAAPATTAARIPGQAQTPQATETEQAQTPAANTPASRTTYTVRETRPAESLWGIAERELGDGERWREIADLNEGHTMVDGTVFRANSFLQPGWQLQMPETATAAGGIRTQLGDSTPAANEKGGHIVTVHSGDYLSKIAEEELGDGDAWPQLFEASRGKPQPHGLPEITDPDVIYAGQQVTVPGAQTDQPPRDRDQGKESGSKEATGPATQNPDGTQRPGDSTGMHQHQRPARPRRLHRSRRRPAHRSVARPSNPGRISPLRPQRRPRRPSPAPAPRLLPPPRRRRPSRPAPLPPPPPPPRPRPQRRPRPATR